MRASGATRRRLDAGFSGGVYASAVATAVCAGADGGGERVLVFAEPHEPLVQFVGIAVIDACGGMDRGVVGLNNMLEGGDPATDLGHGT